MANRIKGITIEIGGDTTGEKRVSGGHLCVAEAPTAVRCKAYKTIIPY